MRNIDVSKLDELVSDITSGKQLEVTHVKKDGADVAVILPPERYLELLMQGVPPNVRPQVVELMHESIRKHGKLYEALAKLG